MPTELEELVGFIAHPNPQIRQVAIENLVPYSATQPAIFKTDELLPIKHLKFLIRDQPKIAEQAATILVNLTADQAVLSNVATDEKFLGILLSQLMDPAEPNANVLSMLLANLSKFDGLESLNVAFDVKAHKAYLTEDEINIMPYILLPMMGSEQYELEESMAMLPDLQLLPPDKKRDRDSKIIQTHVETLTLLATTKEGRDLMREIRVYPIIRENHLRVDDDGVREACERLVQLLMRDEEEAGAPTECKSSRHGQYETREREYLLTPT
ncbi:hypothetical protein P8C59_000756 [Phyllachora maydis]|uniref:Protein HGH1 homolog n=1 Tax=Phyllachora maydis TaxID=1825666 RepID=A0AAD9HYB4_9PEZI|nr:hypothetical protein P8C59_000756 [Phyllachora maydis]